MSSRMARIAAVIPIGTLMSVQMPQANVGTTSTKGGGHSTGRADDGVTISRREPVPFLEVIKDGRAVRKVPLDFREDNTLGTQTVDLGLVSFERSGWFLVRAVTRTPDDLYRFAMTAPFYVEIGNSKRPISKRSAEFFLNWVQDGIQSIQSGTYPWEEYEPVPTRPALNRTEQQEILNYYSSAEQFWRKLASQLT